VYALFVFPVVQSYCSPGRQNYRVIGGGGRRVDHEKR
jgi:hypothetical protein